MLTKIWVISAVAGITLFFAGYFLRKFVGEKKIKRAEEQVKKLIADAEGQIEAKRKELQLESKEELYRLRSKSDAEIQKRRQELFAREEKILHREENLDRKLELWEQKEREFDARTEKIKEKEKLLLEKDNALQQIIQEEKTNLEKISHLSEEEARKLLLERIEQELKEKRAILTKRMEDEIKEASEKKAQEIISFAIQRIAMDQVVESTASVVSLPSDEMKGRIIGREGRNIRALENATGVNVIVDDTPEAVTLSGFDPVRREIARLSLEKLISDGRIHPARIEEVVDKVKEKIEASIREEGEKVCFELGIHDLKPEEKILLGRLKYRTSYGQNVLQHSVEMAYLMGIMAGELKLDIKLAKRIGLLHDLGKAVDHEVEGSHDQIGAQLAEKFNESAVLIEAVRSHHEAETSALNVYAVLLQAADTISAARPGARRESLENYIKRLEKLESIANSFSGVKKSYAIQAGREIRVMVEPEAISDDQTAILAHDLSQKIQKEIEYAGQIKITVIREKRAVDYAK
ncbi:MAG: ribonuclease Y [Candidatus Ratteibacteria bacterium]|nr:ribonuclease Y [Candidatus Ratteibacteria bacterium]